MVQGSRFNGQGLYRLIWGGCLLASVVLWSGCERPALPDPASADYRETVTAFYKSIASIQSGEDVGAEANLLRVTELAPGEPAAWYNLGLLSLRQNQFESGDERLQRALALAPENSDILRLLGVMEITQGNADAGVAYLTRALAQRPDDHKARFALVQEYIRSGEPARLEEAAALLEQLAAALPDNLVLQLEKAMLAAQRSDFDALEEVTDVLEGVAETWEAPIQEPYRGLNAAVAAQDAGRARVQAGFLRNMLLSTYIFRQDLLEVQTPTEEVGELVTQFILLPSPVPRPAPADLALTYNVAEVETAVPGAAGYLVVSLDGEDPSDAVVWSTSGADVAGQLLDAGAVDVGLLDYNYDFSVDVALAGPAGLKLYRRDSTGQFSAVPGAFSAADAARAYSGVWVADVDLEGDLDLVLAAEDGPHILRNNGDGSFEAIELFGDVQQLIDFAWGDFDGDGDPDAALLDAAGELYLYSNERMGSFVREIVPPIFGSAVAVAIGDTDADALMDLVVLMDDGRVYTVVNQPADGWVVSELVAWEDFAVPAGARADLLLADFDNNGATDVLIAGAESQVWLQTGPSTFERVAAPLAGTVQGMADLNGDGLLDFTGVDATASPRQWEASGTAGYHWQVLRPRAGQALGDQRINAFTIGGEVEIRAGLLYQKQPILSPVVHLGLGTHTQTDVARLIWPNGDVQSEFDLAADQSIFTPQRLKGSCPWLFTFDGEKMRFVTDFIWRSPLGLRINAQETAGTMTTEDWVKIRGEDLVARDGSYDLRITAELWETHFFDHVSLMAVDHPAATEIYVDERFGFPPPEMKVHHTTALNPVSRVTTDGGADVTDVVLARDGRHLDFFGRGMYQGITRPHYIDITLDPAVLEASSPVLVASGWVRPTDSSINVAISQGTQDAPQGLSLRVLQEDGSWRLVRDNLGFPAGKTKTILVDLAGVFDESTRPVLRLGTNLEVYWDRIGWATRAQAQIEMRTVPLQSASLVYRGFSRVEAADAASPEVPDYQQLVGTQPRWRDLVGYYTRFGAVEELLAQTDDRYVIMNAGDEMRFLFEALPAPPDGWRRDFILVGDGWVKDGDYNTAFSKTVLPLPTHNKTTYDTPPSTLYEDPVYKRHAADWQQYHTRYVNPERFHRALADLE